MLPLTQRIDSGGPAGESEEDRLRRKLASMPPKVRQAFTGPFSTDPSSPNAGWTVVGTGPEKYFYHPEADAYSFVWPPKP